MRRSGNTDSTRGSEGRPEDLDERARLRELMSLSVLDTQPEERFDRYTRLVADVFDVPVCLLSLVDEHRQWFKSRVGTSLCETDREVAFCDHALGTDLLEVPDALADERFRDSPLVTGSPYIRFYAGAVLRGPTGLPLGTLCVIDHEPRRLDERERQRLLAFARLVEGELAFNLQLSRTRGALSRALLRDPLTDLPGPLLIEEQAEAWIAALRSGESLVAMHLRLRNLDDINRVYGRPLGDELLQATAGRVQAATPMACVVGRLSGARFAVLMPASDGRVTVAEPVSQVADAVGRGLELEDGHVTPSVAVGAALAPADAAAGRDLLDKARHALRDLGDEPGYRFYSAETDRRHAQHQRLVFRVSEAIAAGDLSLAFQPLHDGESGRIVDVEALARWQDTELGTVSPGAFIPELEADRELARCLLRFVLENACRAVLDTGNDDLGLSVNVTARDLYQPDFGVFVLGVLDDLGFPPDRLTLEITEQTLISDPAHAAGTLRWLGNRGIRVAVDDFGTGYSSLNYLRRLPVNTLKIDRSFVSEIATDNAAYSLARGIVDIGRSLGLTLVAEGIESEAQLQRVRELGCDSLQGFLLGQPVSAGELPALLAREPPGW